MRRVSAVPRDAWQERVERAGLIYHTNTAPYWDESAYYVLSAGDVDALETATTELHDRCLDAAAHIIEHRRYAELGIPARAIRLIEHSWVHEPPSIYGRFDLQFDGTNPPKMLEYNADTPTALVEAGVIQWFWHTDTGIGSDQFNSIHERLVLKWSEIKPALGSGPLHFASTDDAEDQATIAYLRDTAHSAEIVTKPVQVDQIGWDAAAGEFVDEDSAPIRQLFKLYPWEWLVNEEFADQLVASYEKTCWIEPPWKMLLSNKGILAVLWELFPNHPNLLECYFEQRALVEYVRKPLMSREGANITMMRRDGMLATPGDYGEEGFVFQALAPLADFGGKSAVVGSWVIGENAAGVGIRESDGPITDNLSRFVPHVID